MNAAAMATLGTVQHTKKDWLTAETLDLIQLKRSARLAGNSSEYKQFTTRCKENVNRDRQKWADDIAALAERALARGQNHERRFFQLSPTALSWT